MAVDNTRSSVDMVAEFKQKMADDYAAFSKKIDDLIEGHKQIVETIFKNHNHETYK